MNDYISSIPQAYLGLVLDNKKALHFLRMRRFGGGFTCPKCGKILQIPPTEFGKKHWCSGCHYRFADFTGTFLSCNKLPWSKVIFGVQLFISGLPAEKATAVLKINYKSARRFFNNIALSIFMCYKPRNKSFPMKGDKYALSKKSFYLKEQQFRYEHRNKPGIFSKIIRYLLTSANGVYPAPAGRLCGKKIPMG